MSDFLDQTGAQCDATSGKFFCRGVKMSGYPRASIGQTDVERARTPTLGFYQRVLCGLCGLLCAFFASSCGSGSAGLVQSDPIPLYVDVEIDDKANQSYPTAVAIVLVYGDALLGKLNGMPARLWFKNRKQLERDFPDCQGFIEYHWEWIPGDYVRPIVLNVPPEVRAVVVFANYVADGDHRIKLQPGTTGIRLKLTEKELERQSLGKELLTRLKSRALVDLEKNGEARDKDRFPKVRRCALPPAAASSGGSGLPSLGGLKGAKGLLKGVGGGGKAP